MTASLVARLHVEHMAAAMALSAEAGWNQTEDDWRVFLSTVPAFG